jgi:hypothetical protein
MRNQMHLRCSFAATIFLFSFVLLFCWIPNATCQVTATWMGNSTSWEDSHNWDVGYVPTNQNDVVLPSGLTFYPNLTYTWAYMNNMTAQSGASLSMYSEGNCQVNVYGNWDFQGSFRPGGGQINFRGSTLCNISSFTFGDVNFAKYTVTPFGVSMSTSTLMGYVGVEGDCWIDSSILDIPEFPMQGSGNSALTMRTGELDIGTRDFPYGFDPVQVVSGIVRYNREDEQSICADFEYGGLYILGSGYKGFGGDIIVNGVLSTGSGANIHLMGNDLTTRGSVVLNGPLNLDPGSRMLMDGSAVTFGTTGLFSAIGNNWTDGPVVTRPPTSSNFYSFTLGNNYAQIEARFATFEYMDSMGINIAVDSVLVLPANCFNHCRFQYGRNVEGAALLTLNNIQDLVIQNADFPVIGQINVSKTNNRGSVTFINASGAFAGAAYERDPYNLINWVVFPDLFLPDTTHNFGQILLGESSNWLMQVINEGQEDLNITEITASPSPTYICDPSNPQTLEPLDTLLVEVMFQPSAEGEYPGTILLVSNDHYQDSIWVSLQGQCVTTSAPRTIEPTPTEFALKQNYPNPFNAATTLVFDLPIASQVHLAIYDITGRHVATLVNGWETAGTHRLGFNGSNLSSGIYFYELTAGNYHAVRKAILLK